MIETDRSDSIPAATVLDVVRFHPGEAREAFGLWPKQLAFRDWVWDPDTLPGILARGDDAVPCAVAFWTLAEEGVVLLGPYGAARAMACVVRAAEGVARSIGQGALLSPVGNDELDRFEILQRLGFTLAEARLGVRIRASSEASGPQAQSDGGSQEAITAAANWVETPQRQGGYRIRRRDELILRLSLDGAAADEV